MAQVPTAIVLPTSPIANPDTGVLNPEWHALMVALLARTGGSHGVDSLASETSARIAADALLLPKTGGTTGTIGFQGATPIDRPTVSGSRGGNAALRSLINALAAYGLVTDGTGP